MDILAQFLTGLAGASSLFLVAAGLTVIFGVTRVVNFSHGSLAMLGAYVGWSILTRLPRDPASFALGILLTGLAVAAIGAAIEVTLLRRIYRAPELFQLLLTFGVLLVVEDATLWIWGPDALPLPRPRWLRSAVMLGGTRVPVFDLVLIAAGPVLLGILLLLFRRTRWGVLVRAATADREMVGALGVDGRGLFTGVFALGAGLAGVAGALSLPNASANGGIDLSVIVDAFVVVVVGGLGSVLGAYLASLLLGLLQSFGILLLPQATLALAFVAMAVVLVVRPRGLLGRAETPGRPASGELVRPLPTVPRAVALMLLLLLAAAPLLLPPGLLAVLTETVILTLFAASLHVLVGPGGMPSFGHAAFFGIGAYAAGLTAQGEAAGVLPALLASVGAALGAGALVGALATRLSGVYLAMLTLAFAQILWALAIGAAEWTGGDNGIVGVWPQGALHDPRIFFLFAWALGLGGALLLRRALFAPFGLALRASRDDPARAAAIGLPVAFLRLAAWALAGAGAGLAGGLYAFSKGSVFPTYLSIQTSVNGLLAVLLGGIGSMSGPIVGAFAYVGLYDLLLRITELWRGALGLAIVALVLLFPEGIAGAVGRLRRAA